MSTRLYFSNTQAAELAPSSWSAGWNKTTGVAADRALLLRLAASPDTGAGTGRTNAASGTSGHFTAIWRSVSPQLLAQTISGTIKGQLLASETASGDNYTLAVAIKVIQSDGSDRGTLLSVSASDDTSATPPEMAVTTGTNRRMLDSSESASLSLSSLGVSAGDRIVVEVGFRQASTSTNNGNVRQSARSSSSDAGENDTDTGTVNPWIEFSGDISFAPSYAGSSAFVPPDADATGVADNATSTVVPPTGMLAGDLAVVVAQVSDNSNSVTNANAGGQTWTKEHFTGANDQSVSYFWCTFNGTWSANPTFTCASISGTQPFSVVMHAFRPPATSYTWAQDQAFSGANFSAATTITITGQTTGADSTATLATWCSNDDNTYSNLAGTGWISTTATAQQRNMAGADQSMTWAHFLSPSSGTSTGNVSNDMGGVGTDDGCSAIMTWKASAPVTSADLSSSGSATGTTAGASQASDALSSSGTSLATAAGKSNVTADISGAAASTGTLSAQEGWLVAISADGTATGTLTASALDSTALSAAGQAIGTLTVQEDVTVALSGAGTGTATADAAALSATVLTSDGVSVGTMEGAVGAEAAPFDLSTSGTGTATADTSALSSTDLSGTGASVVTADSSSTVTFALSAAGAAVGTLTPAAFSTTDLSAAGIAVGTLAVSASQTSDLSAAGTGVGQVDASAASSTDLSGTGVGMATADTSALSSTDLSGTGASVGTLEGTQAGNDSGALSATGLATAEGEGAALDAAELLGTGIAVGTFEGAALDSGDLSADGASVGTLEGAEAAEGSGALADTGTSTAEAEGSSLDSADMSSAGTSSATMSTPAVTSSQVITLGARPNWRERRQQRCKRDECDVIALLERITPQLLEELRKAA